MIIHIASDHAGFTHKQMVVAWLQHEQLEVVDHGANAFDAEDDYPDFIALAAAAVSADPNNARAIIFGGSGQGEAMLANRFPRVRAAVFCGGDPIIPTLSRQHNDSNVLSIGARFVDENLTKRVIWEWLFTNPFQEAKYRRRNEKIESITQHLV